MPARRGRQPPAPRRSRARPAPGAELGRLAGEVAPDEVPRLVGGGDEDDDAMAPASPAMSSLEDRAASSVDVEATSRFVDVEHPGEVGRLATRSRSSRLSTSAPMSPDRDRDQEVDRVVGARRSWRSAKDTDREGHEEQRGTGWLGHAQVEVGEHVQREVVLDRARDEPPGDRAGGRAPTSTSAGRTAIPASDPTERAPARAR